jgi:predicted Ser/Thr protein kinase
MKIYHLINTKIGIIKTYRIIPIEAYSNKVFLHKIYTLDGRHYKYIEKEFIYDRDYPQNKVVEIETARILSEEGFWVPKIIYEDNSRIVYEYIERNSINVKELQKYIVSLIGAVHFNNRVLKSSINKNIPWRNSKIRISQIYNWIDLINQHELNIYINKDKITPALIIRDSKQDGYVLTLRDCGTHNALYNGNHIYLIDFERASYGYPTDDIASLIIEDLNSRESILRLYFESNNKNVVLHKDADFNFELSTSLFEKSLEILTYFATGKGNIDEIKRNNIINKYSNLVDKYQNEFSKI